MKAFAKVLWHDRIELIQAFADEAKALGIPYAELFRRMWKLWKDKKEEKDGDK